MMSIEPNFQKPNKNATQPTQMQNEALTQLPNLSSNKQPAKMNQSESDSITSIKSASDGNKDSLDKAKLYQPSEEVINAKTIVFKKEFEFVQPTSDAKGSIKGVYTGLMK